MPRFSPARRSRVAAAVAGGALYAGAHAAYGAAVRATLRRTARAMRAGDPAPLLGMYADDAVLVFPGEHSWAREYHGRAEIEGFLRRFLAAGLHGELGAIFTQGPPWRSMLAVEFADEAHSPEGELLYTNRAVIVFRLRWGKIVHEELYEDTQRVAAFDARLGVGAQPAATDGVAGAIG
jgi:ketosteroid isomerase-like protein